jgi:hypothetical protein
MLLPGAHIAGIPVEETLATMSPALGVGFGVLVLTFRERLRNLVPSRLRRRERPEPADAAEGGGPGRL